MNVWLRGLLVLAAMAPAACSSDPNAPSMSNPFGRSAEPKDGEGWSILLYTFRGPDHVAAADKCKAAVEKEAHWRDMFIYSEGETGDVFWGVYDKPEDAQKNLAIARAWKTSAHNAVFANAVILRRPTPNPGNPEWDIKPLFERALARATDAEIRSHSLPYYTVVVAEFFNTEEFHNRKQFAADYCADLRKQGYEAYYNHGPTVTKVSIGTFPAKAFTTVQKDGVATSTPTDPRLLALIAKFPYLAVDGYQEYVNHVNAATGQKEKKATVSYVDLIPNAKVPEPPGEVRRY